MGFQWVEVAFEGQISQRGVVLNGVYLVIGKIDPVELLRLEDPAKRNRSLASGEVGHGKKIKSMRVLTAAEVQTLKQETAPKDGATLLGAIAMGAVPLAHASRFRRYSPFVNDRRVTAEGGLSPGSFATTEQDGNAHARTGSAAVRRYALANPSPAVYTFAIVPKLHTLLQWGVVQPAYGQPGGGVEVIFTHGSSRKTVTGPVQIPP